MPNLRKHNASGIAEFKTNLLEIKAGIRRDLDQYIIYGDDFTIILEPETQVPDRMFYNKLFLASVLHPAISNIELDNKFYDAGLWSWLSALYFDTICPVNESGQRQVNKLYRYIPDRQINWRNYYRHLIAFPVRVYDFHGDLPQILYSSPPHQSGDIVETIASRQDMIMNDRILTAANLLYWDDETGNTKPGTTNRNRPGNIRRFVSIIQQLDMTFDLQSMSGVDIVNMLPEHEFRDWLD